MFDVECSGNSLEVRCVACLGVAKALQGLGRSRSWAVTLPNIGVPHRVSYPYGRHPPPSPQEGDGGAEPVRVSTERFQRAGRFV